jgi:integrase
MAYVASYIAELGDPYQYFFKYLYYFGLRPYEVRDCKSWSFNDPSGIIVPLAKCQLTRTLIVSDSEKLQIEAELKASEYLFYVNEGTANNLMTRYGNLRYQLSTGKYLGTYSYRHNYIKQLYGKGVPVSEISVILGNETPANVWGYINSQITAH